MCVLLLVPALLVSRNELVREESRSLSLGFKVGDFVCLDADEGFGESLDLGTLLLAGDPALSAALIVLASSGWLDGSTDSPSAFEVLAVVGDIVHGAWRERDDLEACELGVEAPSSGRP